MYNFDNTKNQLQYELNEIIAMLNEMKVKYRVEKDRIITPMPYFNRMFLLVFTIENYRHYISAEYLHMHIKPGSIGFYNELCNDFKNRLARKGFSGDMLLTDEGSLKSRILIDLSNTEINCFLRLLLDMIEEMEPLVVEHFVSEKKKLFYEFNINKYINNEEYNLEDSFCPSSGNKRSINEVYDYLLKSKFLPNMKLKLSTDKVIVESPIADTEISIIEIDGESYFLILTSSYDVGRMSDEYIDYINQSDDLIKWDRGNGFGFTLLPNPKCDLSYVSEYLIKHHDQIHIFLSSFFMLEGR